MPCSLNGFYLCGIDKEITLKSARSQLFLNIRSIVLWHKLVTQNLSRLKFNAFQMLLVLLIFLSISSLLAAIEQGLLGSPDMQITGNGSSTYQLNWYTDRIKSILPKALMFSVPVYIYQLMILAWSIWLAFALIKWAQWGWGDFSMQEYWRSKEVKLKLKNKDVEGG